MVGIALETVTGAVSRAAGTLASANAYTDAHTGGAAVGPTWVTGSYYGPDSLAPSTGQSFNVGAVRATPWQLPRSHNIDRLTLDIVTGVAGGAAELYVFGDSNGYPSGAPLVHGAVGATGSAVFAEASVSYTLPSGNLWLVFHNTGAAAFSPRVWTGQAVGMPQQPSSSTASINGFASSNSGSTTVLTSFPAGAALVGIAPRVIVRAA